VTQQSLFEKIVQVFSVVTCGWWHEVLLFYFKIQVSIERKTVSLVTCGKWRPELSKGCH